jgi:type II secretory pathway pseudopilin PulG
MVSQRQTGFTYLALLLAIAILSLGLTAASEVWVQISHRQKKAQLDWAGEQLSRAIASYVNASPGGALQYPVQLEDLLQDPRHPLLRRHLRQRYPNPYTGQFDWEKIPSPNGQWRGVRARVPLLGGGVEVREYVGNQLP